MSQLTGFSTIAEYKFNTKKTELYLYILAYTEVEILKQYNLWPCHKCEIFRNKFVNGCARPVY